MTKQEICRAISWNLEPKPVRKPTLRINGVAVDVQGQRSMLGFWEYSYGEGWIPVDYFTSEDASQKLFEAMPEPNLWIEWLGPPRRWGCTAVIMDEEAACSFDGGKRTAIIKTAMKHWGIEGEISE